MIFEAVLFVVGLLLLSYFSMQWWNGLGRASRRAPPSLPSLPLVGSLPFIRGFNNIANFFMRKADELGPIFTLKAGNKLILILNSKAVIYDALVNHSSAFSGRGTFYTSTFVNPNRKGLLMMNTTQEWKKYHKLSLSILKQLGFGIKSMMESRILMEVEFFTDYALKQNENSFNPRELVYLFCSNVIMNIIFGRRRDYNLGMTELGYEIKRFSENVDLALDVAPILRFLPFHRNKLRQTVEGNEMICKMLRIEIEKSLEDGAEDCFVHRYLECVGEDYDSEQLIFTLRDLLGGGTDAMANALLWMLIALANNPEVQNRLRAEIDAVVPRNRLPSINDQSKLPLVEATILEIMRWKTLAPFAAPHVTLSDTDIGDYFVPAGTLVLLNLYAVHVDPKVWKDPEIFRPERFLDKDGQVIRRESVISFSLGRRSCFGEVLAREQLFLFLTELLQRFAIRPPEGQKNVEELPIEPIVGIMTAPAFKIRLATL